ncbi:MAG: hypothetical protein B1H11_05930 [Desulfobacteraceae bacterium 4484_190.1]|nr:MAG: hypothetical protein B1H11_05930 [Desulfobacteraceae bacterium 4484_190.1]
MILYLTLVYFCFLRYEFCLFFSKPRKKFTGSCLKDKEEIEDSRSSLQMLIFKSKKRGQINFPNYASQLQAIFARGCYFVLVPNCRFGSKFRIRYANDGIGYPEYRPGI